MKQHRARNIVASALRSTRAELHLSLEEVSKRTKLNISTISRYENGTVSQQIDILEKILKIYGIEMDVFFSKKYANVQNLLKE